LVGQPLCAGNLNFCFACQDDQIPLNGSRITCDLSSGYLELFCSCGCFGRCFGFPPRCWRLTRLHPTPAPLLRLILRSFPYWVSQFPHCFS